MKIIWRSLKNGKRNVIEIKNNYIEIFQGANFATWSWCGSLRPAPYMLYPFEGWTRGVLPISIFKWSKRPLDSGGGRCDHPQFYLSEQCFGTISKKYRHYSETFRHCSESEYSRCFRRLFQLPTSKNNQNSLKIRSIHWIFAFQVLILVLLTNTEKIKADTYFERICL